MSWSSLADDGYGACLDTKERSTGTGACAPYSWDVARNIVLTWLLTLPGAGMIAGLASTAVVTSGEDVIGALVVGALAIAGTAGLWWVTRRAPITQDNVNEVQKA